MYRKIDGIIPEKTNVYSNRLYYLNKMYKIWVKSHWCCVLTYAIKILTEIITSIIIVHIARPVLLHYMLVVFFRLTRIERCLSPDFKASIRYKRSDILCSTRIEIIFYAHQYVIRCWTTFRPRVLFLNVSLNNNRNTLLTSVIDKMLSVNNNKRCPRSAARSLCQQTFHNTICSTGPGVHYNNNNATSTMTNSGWRRVATGQGSAGGNCPYRTWYIIIITKDAIRIYRDKDHRHLTPSWSIVPKPATFSH